MPHFAFHNVPLAVAALAYVGVVTASFWQHDGLELHPVPLGAPMYAVSTATSGMTASLVSSSYLPNPMGDEAIKAAQPPVQRASLLLAPPRSPEPRQTSLRPPLGIELA
jgi:hypothetical protein